jgi:hypothetical protein
MSGRKLLSGIAVAICVCAIPVHAAAASGLPADWQRGANVTSWWHDSYQQPKADQQLTRLRANGTTNASFIATWYMDDQRDSHVAPDPQRTPTDASLLHAIAKARSLGMSITIKPHVDIRDGSFRGTIAPDDVGAWFSDYRMMVGHYADLARQSGSGMLMVGTELSTMTPYQDRWRALIADARSRFSGRLTFAANHVGGASAIGFWDALDYIGIDAYMPLSGSDPDPSADTLAESWCGVTDTWGNTHHYADEISQLHARWNKPVIFTELGYESKVGAALTPWGGASGPASQRAQANAYEAAYRVWSRASWFKGIYWWNWDTGAGNDDPDDGGFGFAGKAAESTVSAWNSGAASGSQAPPCSAQDAPPAQLSVTLAVSGNRKRSGGNVRKLRGQVRLGAQPCSQEVVISVVPRGKRRGQAARLRLRSLSGSNGHFTAVARRLGSGRYRAKASTDGAGCGSARSGNARFRVR